MGIRTTGYSKEVVTATHCDSSAFFHAAFAVKNLRRLRLDVRSIAIGRAGSVPCNQLQNEHCLPTRSDAPLLTVPSRVSPFLNGFDCSPSCVQCCRYCTAPVQYTPRRSLAPFFSFRSPLLPSHTEPYSPPLFH